MPALWWFFLAFWGVVLGTKLAGRRFLLGEDEGYLVYGAAFVTALSAWVELTVRAAPVWKF